jgi:hypothetical protein
MDSKDQFGGPRTAYQPSFRSLCLWIFFAGIPQTKEEKRDLASIQHYHPSGKSKYAAESAGPSLKEPFLGCSRSPSSGSSAAMVIASGLWAKACF